MRGLLLTMVLAASTPSFAADTPFPWPGGAKAAVSLAYDDALASQLDVALPALDRHGLKGSFYLTLAAPTVRQRLADWRAAAANGHELGNHSLFHQCSAALPDREWVTPDTDIDRTTPSRMVADVRLGNVLLHAIDGRDERTYTVPCGDTRAAGVDYLPPLAVDFVAIKRGTGAVVADMNRLDLHAVPVTAPGEATTGADLIGLVEAAASRGTMVNITFHGVGGDYLAVATQAHDALLAHLAAHRDVYWTAPFIDIMKHVRSVQGRARSTHAVDACAAQLPDAEAAACSTR